MGIDEKDKINKFVNDRKSTNYDSEADLNKL